MRVDFCATNVYCLLHPSSGVQDVLLKASIPDKLPLLEVEQQVQYPLGLLSCSTWTSSLTAAFCPPSVVSFSHLPPLRPNLDDTCNLNTNHVFVQFSGEFNCLDEHVRFVSCRCLCGSGSLALLHII